MSFQDLPDIATKTTETLEKLWDVIGVSQVDRQKKLDAIIEQIKGVYADAVKSEENNISDLKHEIAKCIDRIDSIRTQLNQSGAYKRREGTLSEQLAKYEADRQAHEELYEKRTKDFRERLAQLHNVWESLGQEIKEDFRTIGESINDSRLAEIIHELENAEALLEERRVEIQQALDVYRAVAGELQVVSETDIYNKPAEDFGEAGPDVAHVLPRFELTPRRQELLTMDVDVLGLRLETYHEIVAHTEALNEVRMARVGFLNTIAQQIKTLWQRLSVSEEVQQQWISTNSKGTTLAALRACQYELRNLLEEKSKRMGEIIAHARSELEQLWEQAGANESDKEQCPAYFSHEVNDDVFRGIEEAIEVWNARYVCMLPLLALIEKRESFTSTRDKLAAIEADPMRFKKSKMLMEAEKYRKILKSKRPAIVQELYHSIVAWEAQYGPFYPKGIRYIDVIKAEDTDVDLSPRPASARQGRRGSGAPALSDAGSRANTEAAQVAAVAVSAKPSQKDVKKTTMKRVASQKTLDSAPSHKDRRVTTAKR